MINVACVFNKQQNINKIEYDLSWVDKLYRGVARNLNIPFKFICFSNVDTPYNTVKLVSGSDNYWNKIELFRKDIFDGPVLYFDLDVVICKNITEAVEKLPMDQFLMVEEPYKNIHNSSIMYWNGDYSYLYENYIQNQHSIVKEYVDISRPGNLGDQGYINENVTHNLIENYTNKKFIGWQHHKVNRIIPDPAILIFTGGQKPNNNIDLDIVKENWI
jgi:hypothetical protein